MNETSITESVNATITAVTKGIYSSYFRPLSIGQTAGKDIVEAARSELEYILTFGEEALKDDVQTLGRVKAFQNVLVQLDEIPTETLLKYRSFTGSLSDLACSYFNYPPWEGYPNIQKLMPEKFGLISSLQQLKSEKQSNPGEAENIGKLLTFGQAYIELIQADYPKLSLTGQKLS